ncbi:MAG: hypothetical protein OEY01_10665 [Desulfobulbaceae bacterium]|nr:hypothetical protein [Desulfobulbaceae bacterium]
MKVIYPNNISAAVADEEDAEFPDDNVLDKYPKKIWKATSADAKLIVTVVGSSNGLAIFNTNAREMTVTVKDGDGVVVESNTYTLGDVIDTYLELITDAGEIYTSLWVEYLYQTLQHTIEIDFLAQTPNVAQAGIVWAGLVRTFPDPVGDLGEGRVDYSIVKELNNGAFYTRKRDIVRTFAGQIRVDRSPDFYQFMKIYDGVGPDPLPFRVVSSQDDREWAVFGKFEAPPGGGHKSHKSMLDYSIKEVV